MYFGFYTCISDLTCILRNLYLSYGTYTGFTELIFVYRTYSYMSDLIFLRRYP